MVDRRSQQFTGESWNGLWGTDARYYARRSDGACFEIDGSANVFDLAGSSPPPPHARRVACLPNAGRYTLTVCAVRQEGSRAVFAYGVRRRSA
jgi:hypothetical protein